MKIQEILTSSFFYRFAQWYDGEQYEAVKDYFETFQVQLYTHVVLNYDGLNCWEYLDDMTTNAIAEQAFAMLGEPIARIFNALVTVYNPLENYFTDRTMGTVVDSVDNKTGTKATARTGSDSTTWSGSRNREFTNYGSEDSGTTFESPGTIDNPNYVPISKTKQTGTINDGFTSYGSTTTHNTTDTVTYNVKNEHDSTEDVTENRSGNSGIFSKQDLTQRELTLRQTNIFMKTAVRMFVDMFNTGVWG